MKKDIKIFIVDGELSSLNRYQHQLEDAGYENVQLFLNGITCIDNLYQKPTVVFLNRDMDNYAGSEVLEKIKDQDPIVHVVILSDRANAKNAMDILNYNICDYIIKGANDVDKMKIILQRVGTKKKLKKNNNLYIN